MTITIEKRNIHDIKPYENNPRINDKAVEAVAKSIQEFGFRQPIVVDTNGVIICGHTRWQAAQLLGITEVPVHVAADLTAEQIKAYRLADNKTAELSEWDYDLLPVEISDLDVAGFDLSLLGFADKEIIKMLDGEIQQGHTDPDEVPEMPEEAITQPGDIWVLGNHRLVCGDATDTEAVAKLMDGQKANMVFTDPPYGVSVNQGNTEDLKARNRRQDGKTVQNDELTGDALKSFLDSAFKVYFENMADGAAIYVCHAEGLGLDVIIRSAFAEQGFKPAEIIIWVKDQFAFGRQDYHWRHEPIIYGWKPTAAHYFVDDRTQDTVWEFDRPKVSKEHPTMKPVDLCLKAIRNSSCPKDIVMDLFGGSGSTLIACEQAGRKARLMEIDPLYCDVIVKRWEEFAGQKASRKR